MKKFQMTKSVCTGNDATLNMYLREVENEKRLTVDEERALGKIIAKGGTQGEAALNRLVKANLRLVIKAAAQFQFQGVELADLVEEGNLGLIKAARNYDATRENKFSSYAIWYIRQALMLALDRNNRTVRIPADVKRIMHKVKEVMSTTEKECGIAPSPADVADVIDVPVEKVKLALQAMAHEVSFDAHLGDDDDSDTRHDVTADETAPAVDHALIEQSLSYDMARAMSVLKPRERDILSMYFGLNGWGCMTCREIGFRMGMTDECARQIKDRALHKLRNKAGFLLQQYRAA